MIGCKVLLRVKSVFFFKQKTAFEMRISDWSSDVCSSDLDSRPYGALEIKLPAHFHSPSDRQRRANGARCQSIRTYYRVGYTCLRRKVSGQWPVVWKLPLTYVVPFVVAS